METGGLSAQKNLAPFQGRMPYENRFPVDMNPDLPDESTIENLRRKGQEIATSTQNCATDALAEIEYRVRSNPWLYIGGALLVGVAVATVVTRPRREPARLEVVRDWLRDTYDNVSARLPDRSDVESAVDSLDLPGRIDCLRKKLHLG
jgi:hypothetical protein